MNTAAHRARALEELRTKSLCEIHRVTAITWAWRAHAAMLLWMDHPGSTWRDDALIYAHEAVEHAIFAGDRFTTLRLVRCITTDPRNPSPQLEIDTDTLRNALDALRQKSLVAIEKETAITWGYRAWAAYRLGRVVDAVDLESEAWEHAALSGDDAVLETLRTILES